MARGGIRERNLNVRSGLRTSQIEHAWYSNDVAWHTVTGPTIPSTIQQSSFSNTLGQTFMMRTVTVTIVASATVATRVLNVRLSGKDPWGQKFSNDVSITATASQTVREESFDIFGSLNTIDFLATSSGIQAGDVVRFGHFLASTDATHYKKVFWAAPRLPETGRLRFDATVGAEGYFVDQGDILMQAGLYLVTIPADTTFAFIPGSNPFNDLLDLRYDAQRGGIRCINAASFLTPGPAVGFHHILRFIGTSE